jgi:chemotaxis protein CheD
VTTSVVPAADPAHTTTVRMGAAGLARRGEVLETVGLGSCVAIVIFAPLSQMAGLAHVMLPESEGLSGDPAKFADTAVPALVDRLDAAGAVAPFTAALVGGASMFPGVPSAPLTDVATRNVAASRTALANASIPVLREDVGGHVGRSLRVDAESMGLMVRTIRGGERCL